MFVGHIWLAGRVLCISDLSNDSINAHVLCKHHMHDCMYVNLIAEPNTRCHLLLRLEVHDSFEASWLVIRFMGDQLRSGTFRHSVPIQKFKNQCLCSARRECHFLISCLSSSTGGRWIDWFFWWLQSWKAVCCLPLLLVLHKYFKLISCICDPSDQNQAFVSTCSNEIMAKMW